MRELAWAAWVIGALVTVALIATDTVWPVVLVSALLDVAVLIELLTDMRR